MSATSTPDPSPAVPTVPAEEADTGIAPVKREFFKTVSGKQFVLYAGLLDAAHRSGLAMIQTELIQVPSDANGTTAIVHARVEVIRNDVLLKFDGLGDACPANVSRMMAPHLIRLAETRAKARALRDAVNVGVAAREELGDDDDDEEPHPAAYGQHAQHAPQAPQPGAPGAQAAPRGAWPRPALVPPPAPDDDAFAGLDAQAAPVPGDASPKPAGYAAQQAAAEQAQRDGPPATPKQIETIAKMGRGQINTDGMTRAAASEVISALIARKGAQQ